jgi:hypothetical protein
MAVYWQGDPGSILSNGVENFSVVFCSSVRRYELPLEAMIIASY